MLSVHEQGDVRQYGVPLSHWSPFSFFWANSGRSSPKKLSPQRGNFVTCSQVKPRRASLMNDVIDNCERVQKIVRA